MNMLLIIISISSYNINADTESGETKEQQEIHRVLNQQVKDWNRGDLKSFMTGYWKSDKLTFFSGSDPKQGWQATMERYQKAYQSDGKEMGRLSFNKLEVELLGPGHALVKGHWQLALKGKTKSGLFTLIFRKTAAGWRIIHDHTSI